MPRWLVLIATSALLVLPANNARADQTTLPYLEQIAHQLRVILGHVAVTETASIATKTIQGQIYPDFVTQLLPIDFNSLINIGDAMSSLAREWDFSPRVRALHDALSNGTNLGRSDWEALMGKIPDVIGSDLEEYRDYAAVYRMHLIGRHINESPHWDRQIRYLLDEAKAAGTSVGWAERLSATASAQLGAHAAEGAKIEALALDLANERLNERRRRRRIQAQLALYAFGQMANDGSGSFWEELEP